MHCIAIVAVTIDGKIALDQSHFSDWTSKEDKDFLHEMLAAVDVIVVGNNTYKTAIEPLSKRNCVVLTTSVETVERKSENLIYANFFTNHFIPDLRIILIPAVFILFAHTNVKFTVTEKVRSLPLALAFCLIAFFIWIAENISTFYGAWQYPDQVHVWNVVSTGKITSWFLLVIICFIIVAYLKHYKAAHQRT